MPIFLDRHELPEDGISPEEMAAAHSKDLAIQGQHGVSFITYWCDPVRKQHFCLVDAPDAETAVHVHRIAHGQLPSSIIPVDLTSIMAFLGRITDPTAGLDQHGWCTERANRSVMFTDIVNSMELTRRHGDVGMTELVRVHDSIVRSRLAMHGGREVKHTGDGIMAAFEEPRAAVRCACDIQRGVRDFNASSGSAPLHLRIGIHDGAPVEDNRDLFGNAVQIAARICADAAVDAIVVSDAVRAALDAAQPCVSLGRRVIKGVPEPMAVYAVAWE